MLAGTAVAAAAAPQETSDDDSKTVHEQMANSAQQLAKVKLPMATEPAFHFKA